MDANLPFDVFSNLLKAYVDFPRIRIVASGWRTAWDAGVTRIRFGSRSCGTTASGPYVHPFAPPPSKDTVSATVVRSKLLRAIEIDCSAAMIPLGLAALRAMHAHARSDRLQELRITSSRCAALDEDGDQIDPLFGHVAALAETIPAFSGLLEFSALRFRDRACVHILLFSLASGDPLPLLRTLDLSGSRLRGAGAQLASALEQLPSLRDLRLDGCALCEDGARGVGLCSPTLRSLSLAGLEYDNIGNSSIGSSSSRGCLAASINSVIPRLTSLALGMHLPGVALGLGAGLTRLLLEDYYPRGLPPNWPVPAGPWPPSTCDDIASLSGLADLSLIRFAALAVPGRAAALLAALTGLTRLDVQRGRLGFATFRALAPPLGRLSLLRSLSLSDNDLSPKHITLLAPFLTGLESLRISLDGGCYGNLGLSGGAAAITAALAAMPGLTSFSLSGMQIGPRALTAIAPALAGLTGLVDLDLSANGLASCRRVCGYAGLRAAMSQLTRLRRLDLRDNCLSGEQTAALRRDLEAAITPLSDLLV